MTWIILLCKKKSPAALPEKSWKLVRHVPQGNTWHPATDDLKGLDEYGDPNDLDGPFSIKYKEDNYTQVY